MELLVLTRERPRASQFQTTERRREVNKASAPSLWPALIANSGLAPRAIDSAHSKPTNFEPLMSRNHRNMHGRFSRTCLSPCGSNYALKPGLLALKPPSDKKLSQGKALAGANEHLVHHPEARYRV